MNRRLTRALATVATASAATAVGLAFAPPASAGYTDCQRGYGCFWVDTNFPNAPSQGVPNQAESFGTFYDNSASSIANQGYCGSYSIGRWYANSGFGGSTRSLFCPESGKQSRDPFLGNGTDAQPTDWNDVASSFRFVN